MSTVVGAALGAVCGLGVLLVLLGVRGVSFSAVPARARNLARLQRFDRLTLRVCLALLGAVISFGLTGWPVAAAILAVLGFAGPGLLGARARREATLGRAEAVASWTETVRDTMAGGAGLHTAIVASGRTAPAPLATAVQHLVGALGRFGAEPALERFAAEVADPVADLVVASLLLALRSRARDLDQVLSAAASSARASVAMRRRVEASRAATYTSARLIVAITAGYAVLLLLFDRSYLSPFGSFGGQLALLVTGLLFAGGIVGMNRLSHATVRGRLLSEAGS